jgi:hypothetical protein
MRAILIAAVLLAAPLMADDKTDPKADRERRVRVALALAATELAAVADCGQCRDDLTEARADGLREGKPVVLFVGGCPGAPHADAAVKGGGIPVKAPEYAGDERPKAEKRIVLLEPKADRSGYMRVHLPISTPAADLEAKVKASVPKAPPPATAPAPLNWQF